MHLPTVQNVFCPLQDLISCTGDGDWQMGTTNHARKAVVASQR